MPPVLTPRRGFATRLDAEPLVALTRFYADLVLDGQYPWLRFEQDERWHQRLYRDQRVDLWLISWLPSQGTQLHDHGGSSGAFTVLSGALTESVPAGFGDARMVVREDERPSGSSVHFGPHYIHDVRNAGGEPAVSVHAYSPPLTSMTFYDSSGGDLRPITSVATDDPEIDFRVAS